MGVCHATQHDLLVAEQPASTRTCWTPAGVRGPCCLVAQGMAASTVSKAQRFPLLCIKCSGIAVCVGPFHGYLHAGRPARHERPLQTNVNSNALLCRHLSPDPRPVTIGSQSAAAERGCLVGAGRRRGEAGSAIHAAWPEPNGWERRAVRLRSECTLTSNHTDDCLRAYRTNPQLRAGPYGLQ